MNKYMAPELSSLPCFDAFWVVFCPDICSYFCFACGGAGVTRAFLNNIDLKIGSNQEIRCRIDVKLMPNRPLRRGGRGGFEGGVPVPPFLGAPPFLQSTPKTNSASKMQIDALQNTNWRGEISVYLYTKNCRLEVANPFLEGVNLHFGGCQFTFWRLKLSWGCYRKGVIPKKGGTLAFREYGGGKRTRARTLLECLEPSKRP